MSGDRPAYGSLVSGLGAIVLAVAVFLPWYGLAVTAAGVQAAQQAGQQVAAQFGNASFQSLFAGISSQFGQLAGREVGAVSAHDALHGISVILLILAGVAILLSLRPLAGVRASLPQPGAGVVVLAGLLAAVLILYRVVSPPDTTSVYVSVSLREGAWLALAGAAATVAGGVLTLRAGAEAQRPIEARSQDELQRAWSSLSGWTPES